MPKIDGNTPQKKVKAYPIGYFHIDVAKGRTKEGKFYLFVAIDPTSEFVYMELLTKYGKAEAAQFLRNLIQAVPDTIHPILTGNGRQFINGKVDKQAWVHLFDRVCYDNKIKHSLTKGSPTLTNKPEKFIIGPSHHNMGETSVCTKG